MQITTPRREFAEPAETPNSRQLAGRHHRASSLRKATSSARVVLSTDIDKQREHNGTRAWGLRPALRMTVKWQSQMEIVTLWGAMHKVSMSGTPLSCALCATMRLEQ